MRSMMIAALGAALLLAPIGVGAQTTPAAPPPPPYGMSIGFEAAKKALAAAEAEAKKNNWPVAIAIVDTGGHLVAFSKLDNTQNASVAIAIGKATTANNFKRPTKALQDAIAQGGANLRLLAVKDATPLEGGVPIVVDGKIIGGIGASGVMANQDAEVAMAGANAAK
ncbi:MAG: heme-binding protein [Reyranella sp.]|uniref:GlcG/HbpS family heme-binding protein n=1 Tax=Reyranella sp. TaxID=1929291 RepID=UPI001ACA0CD3|nr:heme-binding protein [Reyranella sp.]MBN9088274.1 heme-binding protein [Reyranella sp.]